MRGVRVSVGLCTTQRQAVKTSLGRWRPLGLSGSSPGDKRSEKKPARHNSPFLHDFGRAAVLVIREVTTRGAMHEIHNLMYFKLKEAMGDDG